MRAKVKGWGVTLSVAGALLVSPGCGDGTQFVGKESTEAKVNGTVTIRKFPAQGLELTFTPIQATSEKAGSRNAKVNSDGTYQVTTIVGPNEVRIGGPATKKEPTLAYVTKRVEVLAEGTVAHLDFP